ncbi:hypothetical protein HZH68_002251 [Vespula germanica]|uniref:Uncharacterized protein n=1 Tax=Vespula germanica TaxID=30212 RepID=A0A834NLC9_VESGE|nr:hypothetical protein HZH68_002251 [Vespula germanica]
MDKEKYKRKTNQPYNETSWEATVLGWIRDTRPPSCCHGANVKVELQFAVEFGRARRLCQLNSKSMLLLVLEVFSKFDCPGTFIEIDFEVFQETEASFFIFTDILNIRPVVRDDAASDCITAGEATF